MHIYTTKEEIMGRICFKNKSNKPCILMFRKIMKINGGKMPKEKVSNMLGFFVGFFVLFFPFLWHL